MLTSPRARSAPLVRMLFGVLVCTRLTHTEASLLHARQARRCSEGAFHRGSLPLDLSASKAAGSVCLGSDPTCSRFLIDAMRVLLQFFGRWLVLLELELSLPHEACL